MTAAVERCRRIAKWILFRLIARGDRQRYLNLRRQAMAILAAAHLYEPDHLAALEKFVRAGDTAVDIGAHFGVYTKVLARLTGPNGIVMAFEPQPGIHEALKQSVARFPQIQVHAVALADRLGEMTLFLPLVAGAPEPALASLSAPAGPHERHTIAVSTLDEIVKGDERITFIKIDIEGGELACLEGASCTITRRCRDLSWCKHARMRWLSM